MSQLLRARWAAIGAAVAVSLGAGGIHFASALTTDARPVVVTITPCRLLDTRPAPDNVGAKNTPIGAGQTHTVTVTGVSGNCDLPAEAIGVVMNVTAVNGTDSSYLTVWPTDQTRPLASNLNWKAGQGATPNQVTTALAATGQVSFYNNRGTVNVIADVTGYLVGHAHDDRYYTKNEIDAGYDQLITQLNGLISEVGALRADTYTRAEVYTRAQVDQKAAAAAWCKEYPHDTVNWEGCNLNGANLIDAELSYANLAHANFEGANLTGAELPGANLRFANLRFANLSNTRLYDADLTGADLTGAEASIWLFYNTICPDGSNSNSHGFTCLGYGM